jgi:hypothetical protein
LTLAADRVQGSVGTANEVEAVAHDPRVRKRSPYRVPVSLGRIDRDNLDTCPHIGRESREPALDDLWLAAGEHLDHPPTIQVRDDRGQFATAAVMRLV